MLIWHNVSSIRIASESICLYKTASVSDLFTNKTSAKGLNQRSINALSVSLIVCTLMLDR